MNIELRATMNAHEGVIWCDEAEADQFSVYFCDPYAEWLADFRGYTDARNWAEEVADCNECELIDYVEKEHEHKRTEP